MKKNSFTIFYFVGLAITTFIMLLIFLLSVNSLNVTFLVFFWVIKFLSGFGLILSIVNGFFFLLNKTKDKISETGTKILIIVQIIVPLLLIVYAIYKIYASFISPVSTISMTGIWNDIYVWVDNIIYIYGILSLLLSLYILPLIRGEFDEAINLGRNQKLVKNAKNLGRNVKKKWFKWRDEFGKTKLQDQKMIKELLVSWRNKFAIILLVPLAIGALLLMPISFIFIVMWLKIIIFDRGEIKKYEKIALLVSIIVVGAFAIIIPFYELGIYSEISNWLWTINIFYLIGITVATLLFVTTLLRLQGITMSNIKKQRFKKKKDKLEDEKKQVKAEREELKQLKEEIESESNTNNKSGH